MKIAINPVQIFVPGQGLIPVSLVEVNVAQYLLNASASFSYQLLQAIVTPPSPAAAPGTPSITTYKNVGGGNVALTPEQFAKWGTDDSFAARCIVENAGLTPSE